MRAEVRPSTSRVPEMERFVVVALVVVASVITRLVIVEVELLTKIPPVNVRRVEVAFEGNK